MGPEPCLTPPPKLQVGRSDGVFSSPVRNIGPETPIIGGYPAVFGSPGRIACASLMVNHRTLPGHAVPHILISYGTVAVRLTEMHGLCVLMRGQGMNQARLTSRSLYSDSFQVVRMFSPSSFRSQKWLPGMPRKPYFQRMGFVQVGKGVLPQIRTRLESWPRTRAELGLLARNEIHKDHDPGKRWSCARSGCSLFLIPFFFFCSSYLKNKNEIDYDINASQLHSTKRHIPYINDILYRPNATT